MRLETATGIAVVRDALAIVQGGVRNVATKGGRDIVTSVDLAVEDSARAELRAAFGFPVIGEERGGERPADGSPYWLIDPICGTR